ncbi:His-Xaa-Ser system radical SAM maturase HxsB [Chitinophaga rupis]|uniref:His-Xaa-Ser system radical SAM maturase HxsB n=1 Tax=Chitinophaga rupis TaxID=573321 RepID=A0A1H8F053_9BACT|nr:His-Xaa-Ser system radical SAM maturase HxsB [Chitinophaga rupis]SEN24378.1 His-Xaa-Ser system radical SAM maturase HxsB [Chitinophaga rupis]
MLTDSLPNENATRKFKEFEYFGSKSDFSYYLLPFRFHNINEQREILVNEIGDFLIVPTGTAELIIERKINPIAYPELYGDLIANFFISEQPIPSLIDVLATRYRTKKSFLDYFTSLHIFVISLRCEHTCHYCQVSRVTSDKSRYDMSKEHIDAGIEMMMQSPNPHVTMEFQGGEALLAFDNIIYAVEKAKEAAIMRKKTVSYVICTNLAPLTEEMLIYFKENNILISTSLDGPDFIHNKNRHKPHSNSYQYAVNGIIKCREELGAENVSALLTTTNLSLQYPEEIVDEYVRLGFKNMFLRPISPYGFATRNEGKNKYVTQEFLEFYKKALKKIIQYNLDGHFIREDYASIILKKMLTPFPVGYVDLQSPAGLINSVIVFNYDGEIYATDESRMLAEMKDFTFKLGTLGINTYEEVFYGKKSLELSEAFLNESLPGCSDCAFQSYCGADPVFNYTTQGDIYGHRPTSSFCQRNMEIMRHLIELMDSDKKIEKIFRTWITGKN